MTLPAPGPYTAGNLTVEVGAKLFANNTTMNIYITVWGANIVCNGEIGNGTVFDGIAFNIDGTSCTITGTGTFTASRIRKRSLSNTSTTLSIAINITLRWDQGSNTQFYNDIPSGSAQFNLTIQSGYTLNCEGSPGNPGNFSMDGITGVSAAEAGGQISVFGTLNISGIMYASTNNTSTANQVNLVVGNGGLIRVAQINSPASGAAQSRVTVQNGGRLELTGMGFNLTGWSTTNNRYDFALGSTVDYSAQGAQTVLTGSDFVSTSSGNNNYWHLTLSGSGLKTIKTGLILTARGNITIVGSAVLNQATNNVDIQVGGNWTNYSASGFQESLTKLVRFYGNTFPVQEIFCPGGEEFQNLVIAKSFNAAGAKVRMLSPVTVNNQLTLGQASSGVLYGILDLNQNALTLNRSDSAAIRLQGPLGYYRYIIAEDPAFGSILNWNIGTSTGEYTIPFGISASEDTIPFSILKLTPDNIGVVSASTYGTAPDNLPWPSAPVNVTNLFSNIPINNTPDNRDWTLDRYWYLGSTGPSSGVSIGFRYNNRLGSSTELPAMENNTLNLRAQYWSPSFNSWVIPQLGFGSPPLIQPAGVSLQDLPAFNTVYTLTSTASPLSGGPLSASLVATPINPFCGNTGSIDVDVIGGVPPYSYLWSNGSTTQDLQSLSSPGLFSLIITDAASDTVQIQANLGALTSQTGPIQGSPFPTPVDTFYYSIPAVIGATSYQWEVLFDTGQACGYCPYTGSFTLLNNGNSQIGLTFPAGNSNLPQNLRLKVYVLGCWGDSIQVIPSVYSSSKPLILTNPCSVPVISSIIPETCTGKQDGSIAIVSIADTANASSSGLLISEIHTDPPLNDSPFEWVELLAVREIDFTQTPYTVIFASNGVATTKGWVQGGIPSPPPSNSTYAFLIDTGSVAPGDVIYVGGSSMTPFVNRYRTIDTGTQNGDGGIGGPFSSFGVLGNGGGVADGIALFDKHVNQIDSNTVPVDAVFFGTSIGVAALTDSSLGFTLPVNDLYQGGRLVSSSYAAPEPLGFYSLRANGAFNITSLSFDTIRTFATNQQSWTAPISGISLIDCSYLWSTGSTGSSIQGLSAGTYSVLITDPGSGQTCATEFDVDVNEELFVQVSSTPIICNGGYSLVSITASGGQAPYNGTGDTLLQAGTYNFVVTDTNGCVVNSSLVINQPPPLSCAVLHPPVLCFGDMVQLIVSASGGVSPYAATGTYLVSAGPQSFTIIDAIGCSATVDTNITQPTPLVANSNYALTDCSGSSAIITVSATGGTLPYSGTGTYTSPAGPYSYIVTDAKGCTSVTTGSVSLPTPLSVTVLAEDKYCTSSVVDALALVSGGSPPYTYAWSNGASTPDVSNLGLGIISVTITDAAGCIVSGQDTVTVSTDTLTIQLIPSSLIVCPTSQKDSIIAVVSGGQPPYQYSWSTGATGPVIKNIGSGSYTLTAADSNGCSITSDQTIFSFPVVTISGFEPSSNNAGLPVHVSGNGFGVVNSVSIDSIPVGSFDLSGDTLLNFIVPSNAPNGSIILLDTNGCITVSDSQFTYLTEFAGVYVRLFIEGFYDGNGFMNLPLVNSGISSDGISVDTIEAILYETGNLITPFARRKSILRSNGTVQFTFPGYCIGRSFWLVIRHRNSLETWSKQPVYYSQTTTYSFSGFSAVPELITSTPIAVSAGIANSGGTILTDGGYPIIERGVCWDTLPDPTIMNAQKTVNGSGTGSFSSTLTGLLSGKTYYVRAYATNTIGTFYGNSETITIPLVLLPYITTTNVVQQSPNSASSGGVIQAYGGLPVLARGVCWDTLPSPTVNSPGKTIDGFGTGIFSSSLTGLIGGKTYYFRAYATNQDSTAYGQEIIFIINGIGQLPAGSFLVKTGTTNSTGLKPYGMIYDLITNHQVPVYWCINPSKQKDSADFVHNGMTYSGGTFAINKNYITPAVAATISSWQTNQGVQGNYTVSSFVPPVYDTITSFPKVMIDNSSFTTSIIINYFVNAAIPNTAYVVGTPASLNGCHDIWTNPHDDPTWSTHHYLRNFTTINKGHIWAQCHLVSMMEACRDPNNPFVGLNFLTTTGLQCYKAGECGNISQVHSQTCTPPVYYHFPSSPLMQFIGKFDNVCNRGSERWYIPQGSWNPETIRSITTSNGTTPSEGVLMAIGPAYGNYINGWVMYQGGHDLDGATIIAENVAAQRAFFNFILYTAVTKELNCSTNLPSVVTSNTSNSISANITNGIGPYTYQWSAPVGTFSSPNSSTTSYNAPTVQAQTTIEVRLRISDACGRVNNKFYNLTIAP